MQGESGTARNPFGLYVWGGPFCGAVLINAYALILSLADRAAFWGARTF